MTELCDKRRGQQGFTLLEVLIALVLLGLLLAALGQGVRFGLRTWELQGKATSRSDALEATDRSLRLLIESMEPGGIGSQSSVKGSRDRLSFVGALPAAVAIDRRAEMTLLLADHGRLLLRWRPHRHDRPFGPPPAENDALLLDGVEKLELAYWRPATQGLKGGWVDEWSQSGLPGLVRIHLEFGQTDPRRWPDIIIAPVLDARVN
jgi:general secretion pathway protein J